MILDQSEFDWSGVSRMDGEPRCHSTKCEVFSHPLPPPGFL